MSNESQPPVRSLASVRFVILAAPRTGSNWLCTLLDSHPEVLCHHEIFNPAGIHLALSCRGQLDLGPDFDLEDLAARDRDPAAVLARLWRQSQGCRAVGFKVTREQSPQVFEAVFADPEIRVLLLRRENRLRTFVSERIALATGHWESYTGRPAGHEPEAGEPGEGEPPRIAIHGEDLLAHVARNACYHAWLAERLDRAGHAVLETTYETLASPRERRRILAFLGVSPEPPLTGATRRQGSRDLREVITNFDHLAAELAGSPLAADLAAASP